MCIRDRSYNAPSPASGGNGGGGSGGAINTHQVGAGSGNSGGGGGAAWTTGGSKNGGSGIVIVQYRFQQMAHFAKLEENEVVDVIVVLNDDIKDDEGNESETIGIAFCKEIFGADTVWKQTSWNASFRKNYAMVGGTYNAEKDAFIDVKPDFASWQLNEETCIWEAPVPIPDDHETNPVRWDEENQKWVEFQPLGDEPDLGDKP